MGHGHSRQLLRAGEGKKLKALAWLVPDINALEPEMQALSDDALRAKTAEFRQRLDNGEDLDDLLIEAFAVDARGRQRVDRPAPLRRAAHGRRGAALRLGRRDEDRRGQDPRVDPAGLPQRPRRQGRPPHHGQRLPGPLATPSGWARSTSWLGPQRRPDHPRRLRRRAQARRSTPATSPTAPTTSSASTTSATTWPRTLRRQGAARPQLRHRRRGRLDPHRRGPHAADHLAAGSPTRPSSTTSSPASSAACKRDVDYEVDEEKRIVVPTEEGIEQGRAGPRRRQPLRRGAAEPRPPAAGRAQGQGAVQAGQGLHHPARRGEDRRRVHRPHPRGPALVARACTRRSRPRRA